MTRVAWLALMLVAGCGSDDKGSDSGGTTTDTTGTGGTATGGTATGGTATGGTATGGTATGGTATGGTATGSTATGGTATGGTATGGTATGGTATGGTGTGGTPMDADGDGYLDEAFGGDDCDDTRADINPGQPEVCNGADPVDDDCDGLVDEDDPDLDPSGAQPWATDGDGDGYGGYADVVFACAPPPGLAPAYSDCDDTRADINPGMPEICNPDDPVDDDCNGAVDDADPGLDPAGALEWFPDADGDGFGSADVSVFACLPPVGAGEGGDDCDDSDPTVGPPSLWYVDVDGDGYGMDGEPADPVPSCDPPMDGLAPDWRGWDCADDDPGVNPGATEVCGDSPIDEDCDGLTDDDDPDLDLDSAPEWSVDGDGDGYGGALGIVAACEVPDGHGLADTDCDDSRADINPGMPEICNIDMPTDDDCNDLVDADDPGLDPESIITWFRDADGDGFGVDGESLEACARPPGTAANNDDCYDADPTIGPPSLWFEDFDRDGYGAGDPISPDPTCEPPTEDSAPEWIGLDCMPEDPSINPGAEDVCGDGTDQDCDGEDALCARLIAAESGGGTGLWEVDLAAGTSVRLWDPGLNITGLTFDDRGVLYGITGVGSGEVYRIDLLTESVELVASAGLAEATLTFGGGLLYAADQFSAYVSIDPSTGTVVRLGGSPGGDGWGYANASDGVSVWRMNENDLREVDEIGDDVVLTRVSGIPDSSGGGFTVSEGRLLYVSHTRGTSTIYEVDPVTGVAIDTGVDIPSDAIDALAGSL